MTVNPFDLRTVLLAKHAQHVVLIHFPIALFLAGVLFDFAAKWRKNRALESAAYFNFLLAAISTIPSAATGLLAWQWALEGQRLKGILLLHLVFGLASSVLIWSVWLLHRAARRNPLASMSAICLGIESITVVVVAITGHLGGFLSGVNLPS
jgi:uncharacterized membrane protein